MNYARPRLMTNPYSSSSIPNNSQNTLRFLRLFLLGFSTITLVGLAPLWAQDDPQQNADEKQNDPDANANQNENDDDASVPMIDLKVDRIPEFATDSQAVAEAQSIFNNSVTAYHAAVAIRDNATVRSIATYAGQSSEQKFEVPMLLTPDAMTIKLNKVKFTVVDATIYGESEVETKRLYALDFQGPITSDLFVDMLYLFPFVDIPMLYSQTPLDELFLATIDPKIAAHRKIYLAGADREFDEIKIRSGDDGADLELRFDPATHLISRFRTVLRDPNMNQADGTEIIVEFHPELLNEVPLEEFIVETENRREVTSIPELYAPPNVADLIDKPAPNFDLTDIEGETIHSENFTGNVIVLAFWRIEHEQLLPVLPALNTLAKWRDEEGKSVEIYAVNSGDEPDILRTTWNKEEFVFDLLLDSDIAVSRDAFKVGMFPTVVIITANGIISSIHTDFEMNDDIAAILKKEITRAFKRGI